MKLLTSRLPGITLGALVLAVGLLLGSNAGPLAFRTTDLIVDNTTTVGTSINVGVSTLTDAVSIKNNTKQLGLQTTVGPNTFEVTSSGTTIWDFDLIPAAPTDIQKFRFFRHTVTSGLKTIEILIGNSATPGIILDPNNASIMQAGLTLRAPDPNVPLSIFHSAGTFTADIVYGFISGASVLLDTTAGPITVTGLKVVTPGVRVAGTNDFTANGISSDVADVFGNSTWHTWAFNAVHGSIRIGNGHIVTQGAAVSFSAGAGCGSGPVCNSATCNDVAGTFTTGSGTTVCTITFAGSYGGANDGTCHLFPLGTATMPVYDPQAAAIVASTILPSQKYGYQCLGH